MLLVRCPLALQVSPGIDKLFMQFRFLQRVSSCLVCSAIELEPFHLSPFGALFGLDARSSTLTSLVNTQKEGASNRNCCQFQANHFLVSVTGRSVDSSRRAWFGLVADFWSWRKLSTVWRLGVRCRLSPFPFPLFGHRAPLEHDPRHVHCFATSFLSEAFLGKGLLCLLRGLS